jgi:hypothetical protein
VSILSSIAKPRVQGQKRNLLQKNNELKIT